MEDRMRELYGDQTLYAKTETEAADEVCRLMTQEKRLSLRQILAHLSCKRQELARRQTPERLVELNPRLLDWNAPVAAESACKVISRFGLARCAKLSGSIDYVGSYCGKIHAYVKVSSSAAAPEAPVEVAPNAVAPNAVATNAVAPNAVAPNAVEPGAVARALTFAAANDPNLKNKMYKEASATDERDIKDARCNNSAAHSGSNAEGQLAKKGSAELRLKRVTLSAALKQIVEKTEARRGTNVCENCYTKITTEPKFSAYHDEAAFIMCGMKYRWREFRVPIEPNKRVISARVARSSTDAQEFNLIHMSPVHHEVVLGKCEKIYALLLNAVSSVKYWRERRAQLEKDRALESELKSSQRLLKNNKNNRNSINNSRNNKLARRRGAKSRTFLPPLPAASSREDVVNGPVLAEKEPAVLASAADGGAPGANANKSSSAAGNEKCRALVSDGLRAEGMRECEEKHRTAQKMALNFISSLYFYLSVAMFYLRGSSAITKWFTTGALRAAGVRYHMPRSDRNPDLDALFSRTTSDFQRIFFRDYAVSLDSPVSFISSHDEEDLSETEPRNGDGNCTKKSNGGSTENNSSREIEERGGAGGGGGGGNGDDWNGCCSREAGRESGKLFVDSEEFSFANSSGVVSEAQLKRFSETSLAIVYATDLSTEVGKEEQQPHSQNQNSALFNHLRHSFGATVLLESVAARRQETSSDPTSVEKEAHCCDGNIKLQSALYKHFFGEPLANPAAKYKGNEEENGRAHSRNDECWFCTVRPPLIWCDVPLRQRAAPAQETALDRIVRRVMLIANKLDDEPLLNAERNLVNTENGCAKSGNQAHASTPVRVSLVDGSDVFQFYRISRADLERHLCGQTRGACAGEPPLRNFEPSESDEHFLAQFRGTDALVPADYLVANENSSEENSQHPELEKEEEKFQQSNARNTESREDNSGKPDKVEQETICAQESTLIALVSETETATASATTIKTTTTATTTSAAVPAEKEMPEKEIPSRQLYPLPTRTSRPPPPPLPSICQSCSGQATLFMLSIPLIVPAKRFKELPFLRKNDGGSSSSNSSSGGGCGAFKNGFDTPPSPKNVSEASSSNCEEKDDKNTSSNDAEITGDCETARCVNKECKKMIQNSIERYLLRWWPTCSTDESYVNETFCMEPFAPESAEQKLCSPPTASTTFAARTCSSGTLANLNGHAEKQRLSVGNVPQNTLAKPENRIRLYAEKLSGYIF